MNYVGRFGQPITDPTAIEARRVQQQLRRLTTLGIKAGRQYDRAVTVEELAKATKLSPERVVDIIREHDAWFWYLIENGSIENWWVSEDGE